MQREYECFETRDMRTKFLQEGACDNKLKKMAKQMMVMEVGGRERRKSSFQFLRNTDDDDDFE